MILIDSRKLRFLRNGRKVTIQVPHDRYRRGRVYAVGVHRNRTVCRAEVLLATQQDGSWQLEIVQSHEETPLFLTADAAGQRADYTSNPAKAAREINGPPAEIVPAAWLAKLALMNRERFEQNRAAVRAEQPLADRVAELEARARLGDHQAQRHLFVIEQRLEAAAKRRARIAA